MFIGESPGREEDATGRPFVGRSGKLLDRVLADAGMVRGDFFITGSVKCRPPRNRDPTAPELSACRPYLQRQIEIIEPDLILLLGRVAAKGFLGGANLKDIRGRVVARGRWKTLPTYHPAAAMRFPALKIPFAEDIATLSSLLRDRDDVLGQDDAVT
jgi:DNA polymerase